MTDSYSGGGGEGGVAHGSSDCDMAEYLSCNGSFLDGSMDKTAVLFKLRKGQLGCRDSSWVALSHFRRGKDPRWLVNQLTLSLY